ncbi:MAG TPA: PVC-type heme-binding CxxCH protein, partial [Planctomycetota bacterium]|nr:PVC-type heme-binding CxxCH protein [Planctomycetota bacterium]
IRGTDARTPAEKRADFHLPPGFEIQLVASEPEISKPMNLAFDGKGRLWVSDTLEYPFPVADGTKGRDSMKVLAGIGEDGKAAKVTTFVTGLNIPIGLYPYKDGVIAYDIPTIKFHQDTDGDGVADHSEVLYGSIGRDDTHGMTSAFRRGPDGWLYACHGFKNKSTLTGKDGSSITMQSGSTYRMRVDGSRVERHTYGQVNPFGMAFDEAGNLFTSDCHSRPIYQVLRGAYYPSFGAPHDGLGFGPEMMSHMHGSTGLCGIALYEAERFPAEFRHNAFVCNVVTSRVNRDVFEPVGTTRIGKEQPDFISSDDPWFRPVDLQVGPDGALYIADFYNKIIGHYEVDLKHPGRDRSRGRIWRVVYTGDGVKSKPLPDLGAMNADQLVAAFADPNLTVRNLAVDQLTDRITPSEARAALRKMMATSTDPHQRYHGYWAQYRVGGFDTDPDILGLNEKDPLPRIAALGIFGERPYQEVHAAFFIKALQDPDALVRRAAADAMGRKPHVVQVPPLITALRAADQADTHLVYKLRQALRDQVKDDAVVAALPSFNLSAADIALITDLATAAATLAAAKLVLVRLTSGAHDDGDTTLRQARQAARNLPADLLPVLASALAARTDLDIARHAALFAAVKEAYQQRNIPLDDSLRAWGGDVAAKQLDGIDPTQAMWSAQVVPGAAASPDPWIVQERPCADGKKAPFLSSLPKGERLTGILRSRAFAAPAKLSFFIAGHGGRPGTDDAVRNHLRLRNAATGEVVKEIAPPRDDTAQRIELDLGELSGKSVIIELADGDDAGGYAWFAVGRFEPAVLTAELPQSGWRAAAELARDARAPAAVAALTKLLAAPMVEDDTRVIAAEGLEAITADQHLPVILAVLGDAQASAALRGRLAVIAARHPSAAVDTVLGDLLRTAPWQLQVPVAAAMAGNAHGAGVLVDLVTAGKVPARVLLDRQVAERLTAQTALSEHIAALTKNLPPVSAEKDALIKERSAAFHAAKVPADAVQRGQQVFLTTCSLCHRIGGKGALVGPQLDGVGVRGPDRLLEDILDPNRNVDRAFRQSVITLKDGQVVFNMIRREEGETLIVADMTGKESGVPKAQIANRSESTTSLMPDVFSQTIPPDNLNLLIAFLLSQH